MKRLKQGDAIGIFSPSSPITYFVPCRAERGKKFLEGKGFKIIEGKLTGKHDFYRSGSIKERAEELNELIRNPEVRCIMSTIGGMNSNSILPYIDYEAFKKDPKIIIGYSDVTAILLSIYAKTGINTFYGPALVASFGEFPNFVDYTYDYFKALLVEQPTFPYELPTPKVWTDERIDWVKQDRGKEERENKILTIYGGKVRGRVIGGNLNTMHGIWGSEYMPEIKNGDILFIEDCMKDAATLERSFSMLKLNGIFDKVSGIILGKHELFDDMKTGRKPYEILLEVLGETKLPFIAEFDCCHTHPMLTLPIGAEIELDADKGTVTLLSDCFKDEVRNESIDKMWEKYLKSIGENVENTERTYEAWSFGCTEEHADSLSELVLKGEKRGTTSLYYWYEVEGQKLPQVGDISIILDSKDEAKCIIRNKKVTILPFSQVDDEFAFIEGEGDKSLELWRNVHIEFFGNELNEIGKKFNEDMLVVFEEFEVIY